MLKCITLLMLLATTVLADLSLKPTSETELSTCFQCPGENNRCYLFSVDKKQTCLKESNGSTIINSCVSENTFFDHKNNNYTMKPEFVNGNCQITLGVPIPGQGLYETFCKPTDNEMVRLCLVHLGKNSASTPVIPSLESGSPPSINSVAASSATALEFFLPCVFLTLLAALSFI
ncbi:uncharacterized protein EV154DRAFT_492710 [Mucor mucedo]|uniref:uncharacterized protein n=1 Tax=Mucor mucedo TaxID=29922 RepID=UPI00221FEF28|nr:uncharacterized protein EV154DRAFT_492710 [Mucor mucedo]KAI7896215.1 hypothetical protein EV154DRAFT_492710 [Mucor mucedo]